MIVGRSFYNQNDIPTPNIDEDSDEESNNFSLKHLQSYRYITPDELALYLSDPTSHNYDIIQILDARFIYEYRGGKIISAINVTLFSTLIKIFERLSIDVENGKSICIVIYCEFSSERGPKLYDKFRDFDRNINMSNHPKLSFPNLFLLEGGYNKFYKFHPKLCYGNYVEMYDQEYIKNGLIKSCKSKYFADYKEFLNIKQDPNLKLNFKFISNVEQNNDVESQGDQDSESQPSTITYSTVSTNISLSSV